MRKIITLILVVAICAAAVFAAKRLLTKKPPNILVILIDTLRADHLGVYGYPRDTSPRLDAFARENTMFNNARTAAPWTPPAVASLFTGVYPISHGMMPPNNIMLARGHSTKLADGMTTIAEDMNAAGYQTVAVSSNPWITKEFGFKQGYSSFYFRGRAAADGMTKAAKKVLDEFAKSDDPFFLYVHYLDPHDRGNNPAAYPDKYSGEIPGGSYDPAMVEQINLYDGKIRFVDEHVGNLLDDIKARGLYDDMKILILADHGEQFREHGNVGHGFNLFDTELKIPMFLKDGAAARVVEPVVNIVDVNPTLRQWAGIAPRPDLPGTSLYDLEKIENRPGTMSEVRRVVHELGFTSPEGKKIILSYGQLEDDNKPEEKNKDGYERAIRGGARDPVVVGVFDPHVDPQEMRPIDDPKLSENLRLDLEAAYAAAKKIKIEAEHVEMQGSTLEELKTLGYAK